MSNPRNTKAKQAVLNEIANSSFALSQPELFERVKGTCDRVTVYRVLDRLVTENKIHKIVTFLMNHRKFLLYHEIKLIL